MRKLSVSVAYILCLFPGISAAEGLGDFATKLNEMTAPIDNWMKAREACAQGNDNACIAANVDPADPCRRYLTTSAEQYACRLQQCQYGNQLECQKISDYNQRMRDNETKRLNCEANRHSVWNGSFCQNNMR